MKALFILLTSFFFCKLFAFDLPSTRHAFYSKTANKIKNAERLRDYFLDEAPDSIFNIASHLMNQGLKYENTSWLNYGKLLLSSYYSKKGKTTYSIAFLKECISYYQKKRDLHRLADAYNLLGQAYHLEGKYHQAVIPLSKSIELAELLPDEDEAFAAYLTLTENLIAQEKYALAEKQVSIFIEKAKRLHLNKALRKGYSLLAKIYLNSGQKKKAIDYFQKTLQLAYENGDKLGLSTAYNNSAIAFFELGETDSTEVFFQKALKLRLEINYAKTICESYYNLAELYFHLKAYDKAVAYLLKMIPIAQQNHLLEEEVDAYHKLVSFYEDRSDLKQALYYSKKRYEAQRKQLMNSFELESTIEREHKDLLREEQSYIQKVRERELIKRAEEAEKQKKYVFFGAVLLTILLILLFWGFNYFYRGKSAENAEL